MSGKSTFIYTKLQLNILLTLNVYRAMLKNTESFYVNVGRHLDHLF